MRGDATHQAYLHVPELCLHQELGLHQYVRKAERPSVWASGARVAGSGVLFLRPLGHLVSTDPVRTPSSRFQRAPTPPRYSLVSEWALPREPRLPLPHWHCRIEGHPPRWSPSFVVWARFLTQ